MKSEQKMLSIITNFGCHYECPYCIVKNTGINIPITTIESLDTLINTYKQGNYIGISISGGGDPMYNYKENQDYYEKLFSLCSEHNIPLELHTSYIDPELPYTNFRLVAFHIRTLEDIKEVNKLSLNRNIIKRIVYVVDNTFTKEKINEIYKAYNRAYKIRQLSFRQMINQDYSIAYHCHEYLKEGHNQGKWYYIEQGDYNTYFVNGKTSERYEDFKEERG